MPSLNPFGGMGVGSLLGPLALVGAGVGLTSLATQAVHAATSFQDAKISFEVMLNSAEKGSKILNDIVQLATETPYRSDELIGVGKQLLGFGYDAEQVIPTLTRLGDVAAGTGTPIQRIVNAFGQVKVAGRLMGTEMLQFLNAGIPIIDVLADVMHKPADSIKGLVEQGKVGYREGLTHRIIGESGGGQARAQLPGGHGGVPTVTG